MRLLSLILLLALICYGSVIAQPYITTPLYTHPTVEKVYTFGFTPSGDTIVITSNDRPGLTLWILDDPFEEYSRQPPGSPNVKISAAGPMAFSRDGKYMVTSTQHHVVWDLTTALYKTKLYRTNESPFSSAAFTRDGKKLLTMSPSGISVWDIETGLVEKEIPAPGTLKRGMDVSPDGAHIVYSDNIGSVWMMSFPDGEIEWEHKHEFPVYKLQISPDGERILGYSYQRGEGGDGWVEALEINTTAGELVRTYPRYTQNIYSARYSPTGQEMVIGSWDSTAKIFSTVSGELLTTIYTGDRVYWAEFSPDGEYVATGGLKGMKLWDLNQTSGVTEPVAGLAVDRVVSVYPNPAGNDVQIPIELARSTHLRLSVVDAVGREVAVVAKGEYEAGRHLFRADVSGLAAGVYQCVLRSSSGTRSVEMQIVR